MPEPLHLTIADLTCRIESADARLLEHVAMRFADFLGGDDAAATVRARTREGFLLPHPEGGAFDQPWLEVRAEDGGFRLRRADFEGHVDLEAGVAEVLCQPSSGSLDGFLRVMYSLVIVRHGGLLLHASSVAEAGRGLVFMGPSGAGKTTLARMAGPRVLLSDETTLVRRVGDAFSVYGSPFPGELGRPGPNRAFPLTRLCLLEKSEPPRVDPVPSQAAVGLVLANTLFFPRAADLSREVFETACQLAEAVPVCRLRFGLHQPPWEVLR